MTNSMTGYGKAEAEVAGKKITVEIRSLNSKQLDLAVKLPPLYREREYAVRNEVSKCLQRGKVDVYVNVEQLHEGRSLPINREVFRSYYEQIQGLGRDLALPLDKEPIVETILRLPDVLQVEKVEVSDAESQAFDGAVRAALERIVSFRMQEGETLMRDLLARVEKILHLKEQVEPYEKPRTELVKNRIRENLESLQVPVDSNRLEQELIFYLEKLDITEEKVRLTNHCHYFVEVSHQEEAPGRKLAFIAQEMGREINTLGSKANSSEIQRIVVQMKDELEKIKEQLLNLL